MPDFPQTRYFIFAGSLALMLAAAGCKSKKMHVNSGAYVTVDGTQDGLGHIQKDFQPASRTSEGILVTLDSDVLFPLNSSFLNAQAKAELDKLVKLLDADYRNSKLSIAGHTDATGAAEYNQGLSEKRAVSVKDYLVSQGISASRITTKGFGQTKPIAPNNTLEGRQKNRRVEITIIE